MLPDVLCCVLIVLVLVVSVNGSVIEKSAVCSVLVTVVVGFVLVMVANGKGLVLVVAVSVPVVSVIGSVIDKGVLCSVLGTVVAGSLFTIIAVGD